MEEVAGGVGGSDIPDPTGSETDPPRSEVLLDARRVIGAVLCDAEHLFERFAGNDETAFPNAYERLRAGTAWENLDLVFTDELGGMVNPDTFTRTTKRLAEEAGVPALTPHDAARHTWATLALASGVHPKVVQERLGHSSISITLDRYSHVIEGMDREAAEIVAALVSGQ